MSPATTIQSAFSRFFTEAARRIDLRDDRLVVLNDMRRVLLVEHGEVDLFAVRVVDGQPTGRWTPLCRVPAGTALLSSPRGPKHSIVGRAVPGAVLSYLPVDRLTGLSARHAVADGAAGRAVRGLSPVGFAVAVRQLVQGIEAGLVALADTLSGELPPRKFVPLVPRGVTELTDHAAVRSIDGVQWVYVESGVARGNGLAGRLTIGGHICLTERDWLVTEGPAVLVSRATGELLADGSLWGKLITHASRLLYAMDRRVEQREAAERESLAARASRESQTVQAAARRFDAVVRDTNARVRLADVAADPPDLAAMRLVASHLGFSVQAPQARDHSGRRMAPVQRIALANGVRTREIRLDESWWKRDIGPMLGRRKSDGQVLALLPVKGHYVLADPQANRVTRVNQAIADDFDVRATALYRPLPAGVTRMGSLLRFGASGLRGDLVRILLTGVVVAALGMLVPIMTGKVLGNFVSQAQRSLIVEGSLLVIAGAFVAAVISVVQNIAALRLEGRSVALLQSAVWSRLLSLPTSFFSRYSTGELALTALGVNAAQEALSSVTTIAALGLLTGSANLVLVFFYDIRLALTAVVLVTTFAGVCLFAGFREVRWQRRLYDTERALSSRVFQLLMGLPKLRVAAAEDRAFAEWSTTFTRGRGMAVKARRVQNSVTTFNAGFPLVCSIIIFALVAGPLRGHISIAAFLAFNAAFSLLTAAALQFTAVAITTLGVFPMLERLKPILEAEPEASNGNADPGDLSGQITLSHVCFRYGEDKPLVLDDISFNIDPGEFVAIVGPTGCGKSTLLRLLLGFESPTTGAVLFDGQDMTQLEAGSVRRQCGVVLQNGALLAGDIQSNIIGSSSHTAEDAWAAARMAGMDGEIAAMPMGMQTLLSEGATTFSGGQRQRIMIARALVSRPRILLFDEATSALDNPTQKVVAESMRQLNATRIVIAHRLSSVAGADRIIVLDGGRIVQQGSFDELLAAGDGLFASLASKQLT
jgi:NHLM bacteriocin system ABC transporter ATP-binding protein